MASMKQSLKMGPAAGKQSCHPVMPLKPARPASGSVFRASPVSRKMLQQLSVTKEAGAPITGSPRWENQIKDGRVGNVVAKEVGDMMKNGWVVLDVRPPGETNIVAIEGAVNVPLFIEDPGRDLFTLMKISSNFGMGGWWLGGTHMIPNPNFIGEVQAKIPKDAKIIVGCQKGLRSLAACEALMRAGYSAVSWVNGGFDACRLGDVPTKPNMDIRYAGIGGVSSLLGWTEVQRDEKKESMGGMSGVIQAFAFLLAADMALFAYEYADMYMKTGKLPWE